MLWLQAVTGSYRQLQAVTGSYRQSHAVIGSYRRSQAVIGSYRQLQAVTGGHTHLQAVAGVCDFVTVICMQLHVQACGSYRQSLHIAELEQKIANNDVQRYHAQIFICMYLYLAEVPCPDISPRLVKHDVSIEMYIDMSVYTRRPVRRHVCTFAWACVYICA